MTDGTVDINKFSLDTVQRSTLTSPVIAQFIFEPTRHFESEFQQKFRQSDVRLPVEQAQDGFRLGVHWRVDTPFAAAKALGTRVLPDLAEETFAWAEPVNRQKP